MFKTFGLKHIITVLIALLIAGFIGYSIRGSLLLKSNSTKTTASSSNSVASSSSTADDGYKYADLKPKCEAGLQQYATTIRAKSQTMADKIRTEASANADRSVYQPQIDDLLAYVKTMQTNMTRLQNCTTQVDQKHDFSASELSDIDTAIAASKS